MLLLFPLFSITADPYPTIETLDSKDALYRQLQSDIADFHIAAARGRVPRTVSFFSYHPRPTDDLFSVAARLNTGIQTLATVNRLSSPDVFSSRKVLVVPNVPGLYVAEEPRNDLEYMLNATYAAELVVAESVIAYTPSATRYRVLPGVEFSGMDTAFFLDILFRFPLPSGVVSSWFGERADPFTGNIRFHNGIDIAAPAGTAVYASQSGTVAEAGYDGVLGRYCIIEHPSGYRTVYGHLSRLDVEPQEEVESGNLVGAVGSTGRSTGPHLHFEIRGPNGANNPASFLRLPENQ